MEKKKNREGYLILQEKLRKLESDYLLTKEKLKIYGLDGDFSENADWVLLEEKKNNLQNKIDSLKVKMAEVNQEEEKVITYRLLATGEEKAIKITNWESDPAQGKISPVSPLGMALVNKKVGEITEDLPKNSPEKVDKPTPNQPNNNSKKGLADKIKTDLQARLERVKNGSDEDTSPYIITFGDKIMCTVADLDFVKKGEKISSADIGTENYQEIANLINQQSQEAQEKMDANPGFGRQNGKSYCLIIPKNHSALANIEPCVLQFYLITGIENIPLEPSPMDGTGLYKISEKYILLLATGKDYSLSGSQEQQIGRDYLKENKAKIKAIISKLLFPHLFPQLRNKVIVAEANKELKIGEFILSFIPLNSYLLELAGSWGKKVQILNKDFVPLISQILAKSPLQEVIVKEPNQTWPKNKQEDRKIYLLTGNPENIEKKLRDCLTAFPVPKKSTFQFIVGIPPVIGGEMRLARIIDYLYTQSEQITNLSKKEYLSLGVSFYDFKLLLQLLQPLRIITLQNSYKNKNFLPHLPGRFLTLDNGYGLEFPTQKISSLKVKKTLISLGEILVEQRNNLGQDDNKLQLKEVKIEPIAISSVLNIPKLVTKIKSWWPTKLVPDIKKDDNIKIIKKVVERRLNSLANNYLSLEHDINLKESLILLFIS
ncbi:13940_t:CDS:2 [Entrophospora sp. SA101]|nr:13940_t:CDS:2 [Entrophospora sp. SA101]